MKGALVAAQQPGLPEWDSCLRFVPIAIGETGRVLAADRASGTPPKTALLIDSIAGR